MNKYLASALLTAVLSASALASNDDGHGRLVMDSFERILNQDSTVQAVSVASLRDPLPEAFANVLWTSDVAAAARADQSIAAESSDTSNVRAAFARILEQRPAAPVHLAVAERDAIQEIFARNFWTVILPEADRQLADASARTGSGS